MPAYAEPDAQVFSTWSGKPINGKHFDLVAAFGLSDRQARFLVTVMLHSGVFVGRQYCAFAGITHGQKVHDFVEKLLAKRFATATTFGRQQRARIFHVHHKPLHAAIGERDNRHRKPVAIARAIERLMVLDGVLADPALAWLATEREKRRYFIERLGTKLQEQEYPRLVFGTPPKTTVRYFPDKLPVGVDVDGRRHVFLYLPTGYAPKTVDHIHDVLSAVLRTAVKWGHMQENPTRGVDLRTPLKSRSPRRPRRNHSQALDFGDALLRHQNGASRMRALIRTSGTSRSAVQPAPQETR